MTIDWATKIITILRTDPTVTLQSGTFYTADTNAMRLAQKVIEASEEGIAHIDINRHNTEVTIAGTTYARTIEQINGYKVEFEDVQWSCQLEGSNNNYWDIGAGVLMQSQCQVIPTNAAGLIVGSGGGGGLTAQQTADAVWDAPKVNHQDVDSMGELQQADSSITEQDKLDISDRVWDELTADHTTAGTMGLKQGESAGGSDVDAIWDEPTANHQIAGSMGKALSDAGGAVNPWSLLLSGNNSPGTFGYLLQTTFVGNFATIINKLATAGATTIRKVTGGQPNQV